MTDVLREFPELKDPRTGIPYERTVLIANTPTCPLQHVKPPYTGMTIAEYFRDMGTVCLDGDSPPVGPKPKEMSDVWKKCPVRLSSYLGSRLAQFYERAGRIVCLGSDGRRCLDGNRCRITSRR